jgi:hypothetical protein
MGVYDMTSTLWLLPAGAHPPGWIAVISVVRVVMAGRFGVVAVWGLGWDLVLWCDRRCDAVPGGKCVGELAA